MKMPRLLALLLVLLMLTVSAAAEETAEKDYTHLTVGNTTPFEGNFFTPMWGNITSDLDVLLDFQAEKLNELLARYVPDGILDQMRPAPLIRTTGELLETIVSYCVRGAGGEADIEDIELIRKHFSYRNGMGGNAVQAALALAQFGAGSIVHLTDDSYEVRKQLCF